MYIAFYIYDGMVFWFGRASTGAVTVCSPNLNEVRSALHIAEEEYRPNNRQYAADNVEPIQCVVRMMRGAGDKVLDLVDDYIVVQILEEPFEFHVFSRGLKNDFTFVQTATSLQSATYLAQQAQHGTRP